MVKVPGPSQPSDDYLAGAVDASGDIVVDSAGRVTVRVTNRDTGLLEQLRGALAIGEIRPARSTADPPVYVLLISRPDDVARVLERLAPRLHRLQSRAAAAMAGELAPEHPCARPDCGRPVRAHGLCITHYRQWVRALPALNLTAADEIELARDLFAQGNKPTDAAEMARLALAGPAKRRRNVKGDVASP